MTAETNKQIINLAMRAMAQGDIQPFGALMHPDFSWTIKGSNSWSGEYKGREVVRRNLFSPLFANFTTRYANRPISIFADGDVVVVECCGDVMTKSGKPYNNEYCYIIRMQEGLMTSLTEYLDTELVSDVLEPRPS